MQVERRHEGIQEDGMTGNRRVVITGMGAVSPIGDNVADMWRNACDGKRGIAPIEAYDTEGMKVRFAGEVRDLDVTSFIDKREARKMDRFTQFAVIAAREAFDESGLDMAQEDARRCGCIISSGIGGLDVIAEEQMKGVAHGFDRVSPHFIPKVITNMAAGTVAIEHGLRGPCTCVVTACAGGTHAVGEGFHKIRDGYADVMAVGGTEACVTPLGVGGFTSMKALYEGDKVDRASIPFDAERSGFVIGEGAGMLVLEEREHALARGAHIIAEVVGYGATCDAYHITAPDPSAAGAIDCMRCALADAGLEPEAIGHINAHGTSTPLNDRSEAKAIREVFGDHADDLPVTSTKSMTGHLLGAAGAIEAIFSACVLRDGRIPPTINHRVPDPECELDLVLGSAREAEPSYVMSDSLGFGGHNAVVILGRGGE